MTITHYAKLGDYHKRTEPPKPHFNPNLWAYPARFLPTPIEPEKAVNAKATRRHRMRDDPEISLLDLEGGP